MHLFLVGIWNFWRQV